MRDFRRRYAEFTEWMVDYLKQNIEYQQLLKDLEKNRREKIRFVEELFRIWMNDREMIDWYFQNQMMKRGL